LAKTLNPTYLEHIRQQHPDGERLDAFVRCCGTPLRTSIRVNQNAITEQQFTELSQSLEWQLSPIPWSAEGYWVEFPSDKALGNHIAHLAGCFYIQEASSMLPVQALCYQHQPHRVLDIAAAPGSKTTQLMTQSHDDIWMVANDMSANRLKMLNANLIRFGISDVGLMNKDGRQITTQTEPLFDSILLDAPCGGEGTIRKDPKALDNWSHESLQRIASVQKQLIEEAWRLLQPGGRLIYSTCTLSREENQDVVAHLKQRVGDELTVVPLDELFPSASKAADHGVLHLWPELFDSEGFFVACLQKAKSEFTALSTEPNVESLQIKFPKKPERKQVELIEAYFQQQFGIDINELDYHLVSKSETGKINYWLIPKTMSYLIEHLPMQRLGIRLCTLIESRRGYTVRTNHEFVRCFGDLADRQVLALDDESCVLYFQGKNVQGLEAEALSQIQAGEIILTYLGNAIGLAKLINKTVLKNQLPRALVHDKAWS